MSCETETVQTLAENRVFMQDPSAHSIELEKKKGSQSV